MLDRKKIERDIWREFGVSFSDLGLAPRYEKKNGREEILPLELQSLALQFRVAKYSKNGKTRSRAADLIKASGVPAMIDALQDELTGLVEIAVGIKEEIRRLKEKISRF